MGPPRSLYRKIGIVLSHAKRSRVSSVDALAVEILAEGQQDFTYFARGARGKIEVKACAGPVVRRVVDMAIEMGLLGPNGVLTDEGRAAAQNDDQFDKAVRQGVAKMLQECGLSLKRIRLESGEMLKAYPQSELPTNRGLYAKVAAAGGSCSVDTFSRLMTLLEHANGLKTSRKKLLLG